MDEPRFQTILFPLDLNRVSGCLLRKYSVLLSSTNSNNHIGRQVFKNKGLYKQK